MDLRESGWKVVDWTHLTRDKYKWRALVNTVMNLQNLYNRRGISSVAE
jgi:hypothetical protein